MLKDFKIKRLELDDSIISRESNIADEWTDVITATVPENRILAPLDGRIMYFKIPTVEEQSSPGLGESTDEDITLSNFDIVKTDGQDPDKYVKVWVYDDDDSSWHEVSVNSVTEPDTVNVDTDALTTTAECVVMGQFRLGSAKIYAQKPSGGSVKKVALRQFNVGKIHRRNTNKVDTAPTLSRTLPLIQGSRLLVSLKTEHDIYLDGYTTSAHEETLGGSPNDIATFSIGAAWGRMDEVGEDVTEKFNKIFSGVS